MSFQTVPMTKEHQGQLQRYRDSQILGLFMVIAVITPLLIFVLLYPELEDRGLVTVVLFGTGFISWLWFMGRAEQASTDLQQQTVTLYTGHGSLRRRGTRGIVVGVTLDSGFQLTMRHNAPYLFVDPHKVYAFTYGEASKFLLDVREVGQAEAT